jgi:hypothetical protein
MIRTRPRYLRALDRLGLDPANTKLTEATVPHLWP